MRYMKKSHRPFLNKVVWITGASSGIGEALAYRFSDLGAFLILSARNEDNLKMVNDNLSMNPGAAKILPMDLEDLMHLPIKVQQALSMYGRIDYLINNAGLAVRDYALATDIKIDQKLMNVNYFGPVMLTKCLLPYLVDQGSGHIVVMSSLSGKYGVPKTAAYAAPKHALHGFFETLRSEIAHTGVYITIIVPGIIETAITTHAVTGEGNLFGKLEKTFQSAYPVDKAAGKIIKAILKKKEEVFVGGSEGITLFINRFSPWLLRRIIRNHPLKWLRKLKRKFHFADRG
jgi:dehydrogenase/reductase SDR family member 7B